MSRADTTDTSPTEPALNRAAAARRRLIRTVGAGGGAAIATLIAGGWQKPVVELVVLPAHGQLTGLAQSVCTIAASMILTASGPNTFAVSLAVTNVGSGGSTLLNSVTGQSNSSTSVSGSTTLPLGLFGLVGTVTQGGSQDLDVDFTFTCCSVSPVIAQAGVNNDTVLTLNLALIDDGQCSIN